MITSAVGSAIVWEWLNERNGWTPYEPHISNFIEKHYRPSIVVKSVKVAIPLAGNLTISAKNATAFVEPSVEHKIDFANMTRIEHPSGQHRAVRRQLYAAPSPATAGISWQWSGDQPGIWHTYDMHTSHDLEDAFNKGQFSLKLSFGAGCTYIVNLLRMIQIRDETGYERSVSRVVLATGYAKSVSNVKRDRSGEPMKKKVKSSDSPITQRRQIAMSSSNVMTVSIANGMNNLPVASTTASTSATSKVQNIVTSVQTSTKSAPLLSSGIVALSRHIPVPVTFVAQTSGGRVLPVFSQPQTSHRLQIVVPSNSNIRSRTITVVTQSSTAGQSSPRAFPSIPGMTQPSSGHSSTSNVAMNAAPSTLNGVQSLLNTSHDNNTSAESVFNKYTRVPKKIPDKDCAICCENLAEKSSYSTDENQSVGELEKCGHAFHKSCLIAMYNNGTKDGSLRCPSCMTIHGVKCGHCPDGSMSWQVIPQSLPSYAGCSTIKVSYNILPGIQSSHHPNPGVPYTVSGFPRVGYLPDNDEGRKVLKLFIKAWLRRLTFTVGTSVTSGRKNTVVWNEIHHKTEFGGNRTGHGYPDPNYMNNVVAELAAHGVTESDDNNK